jgi:hypothetical protein
MDLNETQTFCQYCRKSMNEEDYLDHLLDCKVHFMFIKEQSYGFQCKLCSLIVSPLEPSDGRRMMMRHMKKIHSKQIVLNWRRMTNELRKFLKKEKIHGSKKYLCKFCPHEKSSKVEMIFHVKELHADEIKELTSNPLDTKNLAILNDIMKKKSKEKNSRKVDRDSITLTRRVLERNFHQALQAAKLNLEELKDEEEGDVNNQTDVSVVSSVRSNQMIFEIEEHSENDTDVDEDKDVDVEGNVDLDTDLELSDSEMNEEPMEMSDERMIEDFDVEIIA